MLPRSKHLLTSWLQSLSTVILEPKKIRSVTASFVSPSIGHEVMGPDVMIFVFECWVLSLFHSPLSQCYSTSNDTAGTQTIFIIFKTRFFVLYTQWKSNETKLNQARAWKNDNKVWEKGNLQNHQSNLLPNSRILSIFT